MKISDQTFFLLTLAIIGALLLLLGFGVGDAVATHRDKAAIARAGDTYRQCTEAISSTRAALRALSDKYAEAQREHETALHGVTDVITTCQAEIKRLHTGGKVCLPTPVSRANGAH
jgi:type II secretory pathway pseudopilin PulG